MRTITLAAITVAALAIADGAQAQTVGQVTIKPADGIAAAIDLERQVESAVAEARWSDAASMLRAASDLRPPSDPVALSDLSSAGALYGTIGQFDEARSVFVELADRAAQQGEFATVANAWIDAAHAATAQGNSRSSVEYFEHARQFVTSSLLTNEEAQALKDRLSQPSAVIAGR